MPMFEHDNITFGPLNSQHHLDHHKYSNCCYGTLKLWDWAFGTLPRRITQSDGTVVVKIFPRPLWLQSNRAYREDPQRGITLGVESSDWSDSLDHLDQEERGQSTRSL